MNDDELKAAIRAILEDAGQRLPHDTVIQRLVAPGYGPDRAAIWPQYVRVIMRAFDVTRHDVGLVVLR